LSAVKSVLVVGGGIAGMCAAIELRKRGMEVDLVEADPEWRVYGAGITISAPSLRAFQHIGVLDSILAQGAASEALDLFLANGTPLGTIPGLPAAGSRIAASAGIHAWTAGAIGTMTIAIMSRASLGHTGRALVASKSTQTIYVLVTGGAVLRICAAVRPEISATAIPLAGVAWAAAFIGFAACYWTVLTGEHAASLSN